MTGRGSRTTARCSKSTADTHIRGLVSQGLLRSAGVGPARKKALLKAFGSLAKLRSAEQGEIAEVPGIGPELAGVIYAGLHREGR